MAKITKQTIKLLPLIFLIFTGCLNPSGGGSSTQPSVPAPTPTPTPSATPTPTATPSPTPTPPDPFALEAWFLENTGQKGYSSSAAIAGNDLNCVATLAAGYDGNGIKVLVSDDGVESAHEDLSGNFLANSSKDYVLASPWNANTAEPVSSDDNHGTSVSGLIVAVEGNFKGSRGVAPGAKFAIANYLADAVTQTTAIKVDQASGAFDVFNQSWGADQSNLTTTSAAYIAQLKSGVETLRASKGALYVKSAGNEYTIELAGPINRVGNAVFEGGNNTPYTIITAALNASAVASSYSSPGSNIWVSGFGGQYGSTSPAMITTDRTGCGFGYSRTTSWQNIFESGGLGNSSCAYTSTFNGTSSAAPTVSGSLALILDANSALTWRDVKHILASTSTQVQTGVSGYTNPYVTSPSGHTWEQGWVTNAASFKFHNWYGFGRINVDAAVTMAESYSVNLGTLVETKDGGGNWLYSSGAISLAVPDNSATGVTSTIAVTQTYVIEAVQIRPSVTHANIGQLGIELTSPAGTKSIVVPMNNALETLADYTGETLLTNAFYGETANGNWTIKILDGAAGTTGTLTEWKINIVGH